MVKITQNSWAAGMLDPEIAGRQDVNRYHIGASELLNFLPTRRGSLIKRSGTDFLATVGVVPGKIRMIPFAFEANHGFVLMFSDKGCRAYSKQTGFVDVTGGVPYTSTELETLSYVQCGDIVYIAHRAHPPAEIQHDIINGEHTFRYVICKVNVDIEPPTIESATVQRAKIAAGYYGGAYTETYVATLVADMDGMEIESKASEPFAGGNAWDEQTRPGTAQVNWSGTSYYLPWSTSQRISLKIKFNQNPAKRVAVKAIRLYKDSGGVLGLIAEYRREKVAVKSEQKVIVEKEVVNEETGEKEIVQVEETVIVDETGFDDEAGECVINDTNIRPDTSVSPRDDVTVFNSVGNYPGCVALYQQRLVWASTDNDPARVWLSRAGDFYENRPCRAIQLDDPIDFVLPITQFAGINFVLELGRLIVFAEASELVIGSNSDNSGITYQTIQATTQSHLGCKKRLPPIVVNNSMLFCDRVGRSIRDYDYRVENSMYGGTDVSIFSSGIFSSRAIVDWTYQQFPNSTLWMAMSDGSLVSLTYIKDQDFCAFARHEIPGAKVLGVSKTCAVIGDADELPDTSEIILAVERDGVVDLLRFAPFDRERIADYQKSDGTFVEFESKMVTMPPVLGDDVGNSQFDVRLGQHVHLRCMGSVDGVFIAPNGDGARESSVVRDSVHEGLRGVYNDYNVLLEGDNNRDGRICVRHVGSKRFELVLMETDFDVESGSSGGGRNE